MRATVRLADGSLVEGELVAHGWWLPPTANAAACAPNVFSEFAVNGEPYQPVRYFPQNAAACAANPTAYPWHQT